MGVLVGAGALAAGAAIAGVVGAGVKATMELDEELSKFQASTGATAEETQKVKDIAQELFKVNTDSYEDIVATSDALMKSMGMNTDEIEQYQQKYMDYAKTTGQANADVVGAIDDISDAWGLALDESAKSMDMLKKSNEEYGTDLVGVQNALKNVAPAAKALGMNIEETNAYMNLFAASGLDASASVTAFTKATKTVESPEQFRQMVTDIQAIVDPTERAQAACELFGSKAGVAMANVLDGSINLEDFIVSMDGAAGSVTAASAAFDGNFNVQLELAKKQFSGLVQELGEKFMPVLTTLLAWVTENIPGIVDKIGEAADFIGVIFSGLMPIFETVFGGIMNVAIAFWETLTGLFSENGEAISAEISETWILLQETLSEIWNFISGTAQEIFSTLLEFWQENGDEILSDLSKAWESIQETLTTVWEFLQRTAETVFNSLKDFWEDNGQEVMSSLSEIWEGIKEAITAVWDLLSEVAREVFGALSDFWRENGAEISEILKTAWELIWKAIEVIWNNISNVAHTVFGALQTFWDIWGDNIITVFTIVFNTVKDVFGGALDAMQGLFNIFEGLFTGNWSKMWDGVKQVVSGVMDGIEGIVKGSINFVINGINGFINGINDIEMPDWVPGVGGLSFNISRIPLLAEGGNIEKSGWAIVGEAGPELLNLNAGAQVRPLDRAMTSINNYFMIDGLSVRNDKDIDEIAQKLYEKERDAARGMGVAVA